MQTYYFAEISPEEIDYSDKDTLFYNKGKHYWMKLTLEEDQILIEDTCNRHMPIGVDQIHKFRELIDRIADIQIIKLQANDRIEHIMSEMGRI